ncbi:autotransporter outer membrane beta-barrel domain-containing protein [Pseudomonas frederiksbergensis]|uniref:autotransporter outer membrane beta-barrel domain-containing protein n=1 Tax=Pseudomonas frederiksbergensis TaxID=104087 RepID=UPI0026C84B8A|nr:autotransporter domain-containing protein [Pseudomonas frederiksbergensis]
MPDQHKFRPQHLALAIALALGCGEFSNAQELPIPAESSAPVDAKVVPRVESKRDPLAVLQAFTNAASTVSKEINSPESVVKGTDVNDLIILKNGGSFKGRADGGGGMNVLQLDASDGGELGDTRNFTGLFNSQGSWTLNSKSDFKDGVAVLNDGVLTNNGKILGRAIAVGQLFNKGDIKGQVDVEESGTFAGNGTVGSLRVHGLVNVNRMHGAPRVKGDLSLSKTGILAYEVNPEGGGETIKVDGTARLGGSTLKIVATPGEYLQSNRYTIIEAKKEVEGEFDKVINDLAFMDPALKYNKKSVGLTYARNSVPFESFATTDNGREFAKNITEPQHITESPLLSDSTAVAEVTLPFIADTPAPTPAPEPFAVAESSGAAQQASVVTDSSGAAQQAFVLNDASGAVQQIAAATDSSGAAQQALVLTESSGAAQPAVAITDSSGAAQQPFTLSGSSGVVQQVAVTDSSGATQQISTVTESSGAAQQTAAAADSSGAAQQALVLTESSGAAQQAVAATDSSGAAQQTSTVTESSGAAQQTAAATDSSGAAQQTSTVTESSGAAQQTAAVTDSSGAAQQPATVADSSSTAQQPAAIADSSSTAQQPATVADSSSTAQQPATVADSSSTAQQPAATTNAAIAALLAADKETASYALEQLAGSGNANLAKATLSSVDPVSGSMLSAMRQLGTNNLRERNNAPRLAAGSEDNGRVWLQALGHGGKLDRDIEPLQHSTKGLLLGADWSVDEDWRLGVMGGRSRTELDSRALDGNIDSWHLGAYALRTNGPMSLRLGASYSNHDGSTARRVAFTGFSDRPKGSYDASTQQAFAEVGYNLGRANVSIEPFASLGYQRYQRDGYTEKGGAASLKVHEQTQSNMNSTVGLRLAKTDTLDNGMRLTPRFSAGWKHTYGDTYTSTRQRLVTGGSNYTVYGVELDRNSLLVDAGLDLGVSANHSVGVGLTGEVGSDSRNHGVMGQWRMAF